MDFRTRIREIIKILFENIHERRKMILALSCVVVFVTTYILILPAFTLDKEEAAEQGGIDVPASEQTVDADNTAEDAHTKEAKESKASSDITLQNDESEDYSIAVEGKDAGLSEDMSIKVREIDQSSKKLKKEYDSLYSDALDAVQKEEGSDKPSEFAFAKFYDISLMDGKKEVEPDASVDVKISFSKDLQKELKVADADRVYIVHFAVDKDTGEVTPEVLDTESTDITVKNNKITEAAFTTDSFSVFAVVYTVDFHYSVDGKEYDFSMDGGGSASLSSLVEALKVDDNAEVFVANVEEVKFSDPKLVWAGKADNDTTVGELKKANGLKPEYSADYTKEQIAKADAQMVKAGDWALISLKPFDTEESLTVTMKSGEKFVVKVTDAQISTNVITDDGQNYSITVTYDEEAKIPEGSHLKAEEILPDSGKYEKLINDSAAALGMEKKDIGPIRFFDITILDGDKVVEPKKTVTVEIHYDDPVKYDESLDYDVIHFGSEGTEVFSPVVKVDEENQTVQEFSFKTESFSAFAITSTATSNNIAQLVGHEYVLYIKPGNQGAVLSPESHPTYNNRLRAIPASSDGITITSDEDDLPVWKITNGSQGGTYRLSTTYNNQTVYINFDNENGESWDGRLRVSTTPQDLRIRYRTLSNGGVQYRFTYNTDSNARALDLFGGNPSNGFSVYNGGDGNNNEYFTLYEIGEPIVRKVTVHFVDRQGNLLTDVVYNGNNSYVTKNDDGTFTILNDWHGSTGTISLENDFGKSRYTYANTHLAKNTETEWPDVTYNYTLDGLVIDPTFTSTGHALQYTTATGNNGTSTTNSDYGQHDFAEALQAHIPPERQAFSEYVKEGDQDVYVIMDPYPPASSSGGSGSGSGGEGSGGNVQPNTDPVFHKDMVNNYDGTYELSLSVVGKALNESETPKVNVLLVVDTSSSMVSNRTNYEDDNGQMVYNGTRLAATQVQLRKLGQELLGRNNLQNDDTDDDDIVEVAMVTFDGEAYPDTLRWTNQYSKYQTAVNGLDTHRGTDWEDALDAALIKAQEIKDAQPNEPVYVLFFTDGEPSQYRNFHGTQGLVNGQITDDSVYGYRYFFAMYGKEASKDEARAIVSVPGVQLYTMFAFGPTDSGQATYYGKTQFELLHDTVKYAYNTNPNTSLENKYAFNATDSTKLNKAFDEILRQISSSLGITDVVMNDSFTSLTVPGVNNTETGTGGFRYWQIPAGGTWEDRVEWSEAPHATYDEETGVKWDLHGITLQNDVTYAVTFTVWPSQEAYDWVADLKNGIRTWEQAEDAGLANNVIFRTSDGNGGYKYDVQTNPQSTVPSDGSVGTNGITYTKTEEEIVYEKGQNSERDYTTEDPNTFVHETITYTDNHDGTWTKTVVSEVVTAFNMPDKRMDLTNTDFNVEKFWDMNGKLTELHKFLYHYDEETEEWVSNKKQITFKISKGYDNNGDPKPYDKFGTDGLPLGWQTDENEYDWVGPTTSIEGDTIGTRWQEDLDISFGLMLTHEQAVKRGLDLTNRDYLRTTYQGVTYYLLDYGWDYAIDEVNGLNYQFDFRSSVYHPMLIDGKPAHVKFTVENGVWTITEMEKDLTALTGNNILRSELRLQKELLDVDGNRIKDDDTTTFEFTVNLVNEDHVFIPHEDVESVPWYAVSRTTEVDGHTVTQNYFYQYAPGGVFDHYATEAEATITQPNGSLVLKEGYIGNVMQHGGDSATVTFDGSEYTGYTQASATIHVKAEEDWSIANIPLGTVVTVSEPEKAGYTFVNAKLDNNVIQTTTSEDGTHTTVGTTIPPGSQSTIKITNQELPLDLMIFKAELTDEGDVLLDGSKFSLFKWDETSEIWLTVSGVTNPFSVSKDTGHLIQNIQPGLYKLQEDQAPAGYIITQDTYFKVVDREIVLCDESGNTTTGSGDDAVPYVNEMAKIETTDNVAQIKLTVYNEPGPELPHAGGIGTTIFYVFGAILTLGSAIILVSRRRIQKDS